MDMVMSGSEYSASEYIQEAKTLESYKSFDLADEVLRHGLIFHPQNIKLIIELAELQEKKTPKGNSRAMFCNLVFRNPYNPLPLISFINFSLRCEDMNAARGLLARAMKSFETNGRVWAIKLQMAPSEDWKTVVEEGNKVCKHDPYWNAAKARLYLIEEFDIFEARRCLNVAIRKAPHIGDFWALYYQVESRQAEINEERRRCSNMSTEQICEDGVADIIRGCVRKSPKGGVIWQEVANEPCHHSKKTDELLPSGVPDGQPKFLLSLIPDYPLLKFMLTTSIYIAVSYRLFELTKTLKTTFVPSKDDKRLGYNIVAAVVVATCLYTLSFVLLRIPQMMLV